MRFQSALCLKKRGGVADQITSVSGVVHHGPEITGCLSKLKQ
jgi:hypothetical protein